ncbi:saccharopine dehydrogenase family protein [Marinithermus hydrothermalis]|uniref:Saccharopine dehydrogenase n=1 Tax=Marinithermus hydrothermalis (strain DSM 14884 / JCM 11576 / T1) TaxID=869210 RepID=F2NN90_MARHT|nr:saccharopine dehydrogenase NADP-binding domain-containing protein [Marinithermus hydrothermalis]AEB10931.1 Saccharopine dehydrogenase [Marinithermus hydrothermalis DSM 14884]
MRIGVLGGCGDMGSRAVEVLAERPEVEEVRVLDANAEAGRALEQRFERVRFQAVDARDRASLVAALAGLDAVASALGPFYLFERPLAEAALEAGVPYVSLCDDHEAAKAVLELDAAAREKGIAIITGLGWTPGLTNLAARRLYAELGGLEAVRIFWAGASADAKGHAVVLHTLYAFNGFVPRFVDGLFEWVPAGSAPEPVAFPPPVGTVLNYYLGHPEPVTLPRYLPVARVELKGGLSEQLLNSLGGVLARLGLFRTHARRERVSRLLKPLLPPLERLSPGVAASAWRVEGSHAGQRKAYWGAGRMRDLTGVPLALGALFLAEGRVERTGAFAPEAEGFPHMAFWEALEAYGVRAEAAPVD